jgi:hypothetical protein
VSVGIKAGFKRRINAYARQGWKEPVLLDWPTQTVAKLGRPSFIAWQPSRIAERDLGKPYVVLRQDRPALRCVMIMLVPLNVDDGDSVPGRDRRLGIKVRGCDVIHLLMNG